MSRVNNPTHRVGLIARRGALSVPDAEKSLFP